MAGKITPILARKCVNIFRISQEEYPGGIENGHCVAIAQPFEAELRSLAPSFPTPVYIKPETIRLWVSTLQIALPAQFYRIRCPVIVGHAAKYRIGLMTFSGCSSFIVLQITWIVTRTPITHLR